MGEGDIVHTLNVMVAQATIHDTPRIFDAVGIRDARSCAETSVRLQRVVDPRRREEGGGEDV